MVSRFAPGVSEQLGFYVYLLIDPRSRRVFYVGKGTGNRCFEHIAAADKTDRDHAREFAKLDRIRKIQRARRAVRIEVLRHGLDEETAFEIEAAAIDLLGLDELTNVVAGSHAARRGRMSILDINALFGATPVEIDPSHAVLLIRIAREWRRGMTDKELYEATRSFWRIDSRWTDLKDPRSPRHAFAVAGGVVRAVYRIQGWGRPTATEIRADPRREGRWGFRGTRDRAMEDTYLGRDVTAYLSAGAQNPIAYANAGPRA